MPRANDPIHGEGDQAPPMPADHPTTALGADGSATLQAAEDRAGSERRDRKDRSGRKPRKDERGKGAKAKDDKKPAKGAKAQKKKPRKAAGKKPRKAPAREQSKHVLYQLSVQAPDEDAKFLQQYFEDVTGRRGTRFREDFCGTGILACNWVLLDEQNTAVGVDIDRKTLQWGVKNNLGKLLDEAQRERVQLIESDVLEVTEPEVDLIAALNFSYSFFTTRPQLRTYMETCRKALADDGVLFLDAWGGSQTQEVMEEERKIVSDDVETFTYIWDQADFDPVSYHSECRIHFRFKDGSEKRNAFRYRWRQWTLPEMRELMEEAGFHDVHILWEGTDEETGEGDGEYTRQERGDADLGWIAYVVGHKNPPPPKTGRARRKA